MHIPNGWMFMWSLTTGVSSQARSVSKTSPYHPASSGLAERAVQTLVVGTEEVRAEEGTTGESCC